jgi:rubredoxin
MDTYTCPVCGYPRLLEPAYDLGTVSPSFNICPCCGCEFGYDDATPWAKESFLKNWVKRGSPWFHPELKPSDWNVREQLQSIGIEYQDLLS